VSAALVRVKAVPGARRGGIAGVLGDRVKLRVAAPREDGRANAALAELLAGALGVRPAAVRLVSGAANPEKLFRVEGVTPASAAERLGLGPEALGVVVMDPGG
jgi:hypothetical protein